MRGLRVASVLLACALLGAAGCSSIESDPDQVLVRPGTVDLSLPRDPLFANWKVEVTQLGMHRFGVSLRMRRVFIGGEGESAPVLRRTAEKLRREGGYTGYVVLEQSEGIESHLPVAQRVAHAVIELY